MTTTQARYGRIPNRARRLHVAADTYRWLIGKKHTQIWGPLNADGAGPKHVVDHSTLTGRSWTVLEAGGVEIEPHFIHAFISRGFKGIKPSAALG